VAKDRYGKTAEDIVGGLWIAQAEPGLSEPGIHLGGDGDQQISEQNRQHA
jgi:hypothetical protein